LNDFVNTYKQTRIRIGAGQRTRAARRDECFLGGFIKKKEKKRKEKKKSIGEDEKGRGWGKREGKTIER